MGVVFFVWMFVFIFLDVFVEVLVVLVFFGIFCLFDNLKECFILVNYLFCDKYFSWMDKVCLKLGGSWLLYLFFKYLVMECLFEVVFFFSEMSVFLIIFKWIGCFLGVVWSLSFFFCIIFVEGLMMGGFMNFFIWLIVEVGCVFSVLGGLGLLVGFMMSGCMIMVFFVLGLLVGFMGVGFSSFIVCVMLLMGFVISGDLVFIVVDVSINKLIGLIIL